MAIFQHSLWGFELTFPDDWAHQNNADADGFAKNSAVFDQVDSANQEAAHLLVRGEWNGFREPIAPRWNQHITKLSIMVGAKKLGSSPFSMAGANGFEAEIQMPQRENRRLWTAILARDTVILHLMVSHPREERDDFEPLATQIIASLRFVDRIDNLAATAEGIPLPPGYSPVDPASIIPDAQDGNNWSAYDGKSGIGALQAFFYRELPHYGWDIQEFIPYPNHVDIHFGRLRIHKDDLTATLGIIPNGEKEKLGELVIKFE
ncbi:MAG: hypothetical protein ABFS03_00665 [Chloroflexota bacterium]